MNLYLHGIDADPCPIQSGADALASDPGDRFSMVLTNPPFGKKSTVRIVNEEGELETESDAYERQDFWTSTKNKQLNFLQHVKTLLAPQRLLRHRGARQRAVRGRAPARRAAQPAPAVRRPHAAAAADGHLLRPGRQGERPLLRRQAGPRAALDGAALGLRPANQQALHAEDEAAPASRPGRVRRLLPARASAASGSRHGARRTRPEGGGPTTTTNSPSATKLNLDISWLKDRSLEDAGEPAGTGGCWRPRSSRTCARRWRRSRRLRRNWRTIEPAPRMTRRDNRPSRGR